MLKALDVIHNLNYRAILMSIYPAGLRVEDIDTARKMICIQVVKWKDNRYMMLSKIVLRQLRGCHTRYKLQRSIIEGVEGWEHISEGSMQEMFERSVKRSGTGNVASVHPLRNPSNTHLLESGVDLRHA